MAPLLVAAAGLALLVLPLLAAGDPETAMAGRVESHHLRFLTEGGAVLNMYILIDSSSADPEDVLAEIAEWKRDETGAVLLEEPEVGAAFTTFGKWADSDIPVPVAYNDDFDPPGIDGQAVVLSQMATWNAVTDQDFSFSDGGESTTVDSVCDTDEDGINNVVFGGNFPSGVLAWVCTLDLPNVDDDFYDEFDMQIAEDWNWSTDDNTLPGEFDLQTVVLHELGHALGLDHEANLPAAVMFPYVDDGVQKRTLTQDDINGMRFLYGDYVPPTHAPSDTPDVPTDTPTPTATPTNTATATATATPTDAHPFEAVAPGLRRD